MHEGVQAKQEWHFQYFWLRPECGFMMQVALDVNVGSASAVPQMAEQVTLAVSTGTLQVRAHTSHPQSAPIDPCLREIQIDCMPVPARTEATLTTRAISTPRLR